MRSNQNFGEFFKNKRLELGLTLREFCRVHGLDAGNVSKLERGVLMPSRDEDKLTRYAEALNLRRGSAEWDFFFDLADIANKRLPDDVSNNVRLLEALPIFFRTVRGKETDDEDRKKLAEYHRKDTKSDGKMQMAENEQN